MGEAAEELGVVSWYSRDIRSRDEAVEGRKAGTLEVPYVGFTADQFPKIETGDGEPKRDVIYRDFKMPAWQFRSGGVEVIAKKPVAVHMLKGDHLWFAQSDNLDIYATGETPMDALQDFHVQLVHFFKHYRSRQHKDLVGHALKLKAIFEENFEEATPQ